MRTEERRRGYVGRLLAVGVVLSLPLAASCLNAQQGPLAPEQTKFLGNVWSSAQLEDFTTYWNQVTPENAGKWGPMEPQPGQFNWANLDAAYALAKDNGLPFRFHVLVWGNQQPRWVMDLSTEEQMVAIERRWRALAERYPDMDYIEVVNEPLNDPPRARNENDNDSGNYIEALGGDGETGWDWIINSFRMAREIFPNSKLVLNEYSITNSTRATDRYLEIIGLLQAENLIDVIGVQGHTFSTTVASEVTKENLDRLAATGLPIMVTEMDINRADDEVHLAEYQRIFPIFWEHPSVIGITLWGWRLPMWQREGNLVRADGTHRPAFDWLMEYTRSDR